MYGVLTKPFCARRQSGPAERRTLKLRNIWENAQAERLRMRSQTWLLLFKRRHRKKRTGNPQSAVLLIPVVPVENTSIEWALLRLRYRQLRIHACQVSRAYSFLMERGTV